MKSVVRNSHALKIQLLNGERASPGFKALSSHLICLFSFDLECQCTTCPSNGFCSDRRDLGASNDPASVKQACEALGLEMPVPTSAADAAIALGSDSRIWLGISDVASEGTWVNVHDSTTPSYFNWPMDEISTTVELEPNDCCTFVPFLDMPSEQETG